MPYRDGDCLAVAVENPRNDERLLLGAKLADGRSHGHAEEHVRRLRLAAHESVAAGRPAPKLRHARLDSVPWKKPFACATTIGAQSVNGRIPKVSCLTSGSPASATSSARPRSSNRDKIQAPPLDEETPVAPAHSLRVRLCFHLPAGEWSSIPISLSCC